MSTFNGGVQFTRGAARRPAPNPSDPLMQWSTGLPTTNRSLYAGWLIPVGQAEDLDRALHHAEAGRVTIRHSGGNTVEHWTLPVADVFVLADGVQTMAEMKSTSERFGIAFGWRELPDGRPQSILRTRVIVRTLLEQGYTHPLMISVKSTLTGDLLTALMRQYDVLDAASAEQERAGKQGLALPFYAFSIPLGAGAEVARGKGQTKEIAPIIAHIPEPVTREYLTAHYMRREWVTAIERRIDETLAWSVASSAQIAVGVEEAEPVAS